MKSVGLITSWRDNYGSALQCYATKIYVQEMGFHCDVLYEDNKGIEKYKHYLKRALFLGTRALFSKEFYSKYKIMKNNAQHASAKIEKDALRLLCDFAETELQPRGVDYTLLKQLAHSEEYVAFIAGSDQIWNAQEPMNPACFLSFAPDCKKIALAPSFGTNDIAKFNKRDFKKGLFGFEHLSVREEAGVDIIKKLTGKTVERLPDPTILLTPAQWRTFADEGIKRAAPYILLHFLDEPSRSAVEFIKQAQKQTECDLLVFAYDHEEWKNLDKVHFVNGDPRDYVSLIDGAKYVCTDSFHTTLFSIYLRSPFCTFERVYKKIAPQSSRLHTLLKLYDYQQRFISRDSAMDATQLLQMELRPSENVLKEERHKIEDYLKNALRVDKSGANTEPALKDAAECTGCGVCVAVCPQKAISFQNEPIYKYAIPTVDQTKCIHCGLCEKKCHNTFSKLSQKRDEKNAYVVYNENPVMRNKSASGGVFSALAAHFIENNGVVFGAKLDFRGEQAKVYHAKAESMEELMPLLNSKYVQSNCSDCYPAVRDYLDQGRNVLFSGTSCQIKALYSYLGKEHENLYTADLICHGVPGEQLFQEYVTYLEAQYQGKIVDFSFRKKRGGDTFYVITTVLETNDGKKTVEIEMKHSAYYRMFMSEDSYRENCYRCAYATVDKPADITIGDYYEAIDDYPELFDGTVRSLRIEDGISCVIAHNRKGRDLLNDVRVGLCLIPADVQKVQRSHRQLCKPSMYSLNRKKYFNLYKQGGYYKIQKFIARRDALKTGMKTLLRKNG